MDRAIIDDHTPDRDLFPPGKGRGLSLAGREPGYAYSSTARPLPPEWLIPRSEWQARIEEREAAKARLSDIVDQAKLPCKDQGTSNFCWANATTHTLEIARAVQGEPTVILSAASVGAPITGYRNQGGYGPDALEYLDANGAVPESAWPANAIDKRYATQANLALGRLYRVAAWIEAAPQSLDETISLLLLDVPVAVGLGWWGHEVTYYDPLWLDGEIAIRARNSWGMAWGDRGYFTLRGRRMLPDDAVAPTMALPG